MMVIKKRAYEKLYATGTPPHEAVERKGNIKL
jgi:hypothetical protein